MLELDGLPSMVLPGVPGRYLCFSRSQ